MVVRVNKSSDLFKGLIKTRLKGKVISLFNFKKVLGVFYKQTF